MELFFYIFIIVGVFFIIVFTLKKHYEQKAKILSSLKNGICPSCGAFTDEDGHAIEYKLLNNGGCSGVSDMLYTCIKCNKTYFIQERVGGCCGR
jgi:RNase P subunit RPR2